MAGDTTIMGMDRRAFLKRTAYAGTAAALGSSLLVRDLAAAQPDHTLAPFLHGVASGDPLTDGVILWTRVTPPGEANPSTIPTRWVVAHDVDLRDVVASGTAFATPERDYTVKVDVRGLEPGRWYFYGFEALGARSLTGRTKTAPAGGVEHLRFAVVACSNYQGGYFNVYGAIAERQDLDAVLHLGDYIYEGEAEPGSMTRFAEPRAHTPATEIFTLDDYRMRHGQYRLDPDLRRAHQLFPWITTWDDHESANNAWKDGPGPGNPTDGDGTWTGRKAIAQRVYEEWLPIRTDDPTCIYRTLSYGDLADVVVLDTRLDGRDRQVGKTGLTILENETRNPDRQLISPEQRSFFFDALSTSKASGTRWRIVAQQVMMAPLNVVGLPNAKGLLGVTLPDVPLFLTSGPTSSLNTDQWDGYHAERERFYDHLLSNEIDNVVVLTGDIHTSWANDLSPDSSNPLVDPVAVEMVCSSVTSGGFEYILGSVEAARLAEPLVQLVNPHIKWTDLTRRGYLLLDITPERVQGEWYLFETVRTRNLDQSLEAVWQTVNGANRLSAGDGPAPRGQIAPATPSATAGDAVVAAEVVGAGDQDVAVQGVVIDRAAVPAAGRLPATGATDTLLPGAALVGAAGLAELLRRRMRSE